MAEIVFKNMSQILGNYAIYGIDTHIYANNFGYLSQSNTHILMN